VKSLIILMSYHHMNTEKIARVFAKVLDAEIRTPWQVDPEELRGYDIIGFGSGIYSGKNHQDLLDLADKLPPAPGMKAFIFSTSAIVGKEKVAKDHALLKEKLQSRGYVILDEFSCKGFNTNSFLRFFGGVNKGRPNADDLRHAEEFAVFLKQKTQ
jgi:flavodoxin